MRANQQPAYGATVTITGQGREISGGALIGCATRQDASVFVYAYVLVGISYPVTGTPETTWSVTVNGTNYSFPASEEGKSWTTQPLNTAVLPITIHGQKCTEAPGSLIYWPESVDSDGTVEPPTGGSSGVYFDAENQSHTVEFKTTWAVPDFGTVFSWDACEPLSGPYKCHTSGLGDSDTWVAGDPPPGGEKGAGGSK